MYRVFNMGIGLILVTAPRDVDPVIARLSALGDHAMPIGEVVQRMPGKDLVEYGD
jgi:phosphoribosylformylglycinamidine cyclo-ligase